MEFQMERMIHYAVYNTSHHNVTLCSLHPNMLIYWKYHSYSAKQQKFLETEGMVFRMNVAIKFHSFGDIEVNISNSARLFPRTTV